MIKVNNVRLNLIFEYCKFYISINALAKVALADILFTVFDKFSIYVLEYQYYTNGLFWSWVPWNLGKFEFRAVFFCSVARKFVTPLCLLQHSSNSGLSLIHIRVMSILQKGDRNVCRILTNVQLYQCTYVCTVYIKRDYFMKGKKEKPKLVTLCLMFVLVWKVHCWFRWLFLHFDRCLALMIQN